MSTYLLQGTREECEAKLAEFIYMYKIISSNIVPIGYQWILAVTYEEIEDDDNNL